MCVCVFYNWKNFVYDLLYDTKLEVDVLHDILSFFSEFRHKKLHFNSQLIVQIVLRDLQLMMEYSCS